MLKLGFRAEAEKLSALANEKWGGMRETWWLDEEMASGAIEMLEPGQGAALDAGGGVVVWLVMGAGSYTVYGFCRGETRELDRMPGIASRAPSGSEWLAFFEANKRKRGSRANPDIEANAKVAVLLQDRAWCLGVVKAVGDDGKMAKVMLGDGGMYEPGAWISYFAWDAPEGFDKLWAQGRTRFGAFSGMIAAEKAARGAAPRK
jgi:hypothetical protein